MSTGADLNDSFATQYDEVQSGYFAPAQLQEFCDTAIENVFERLVESYQKDAKSADELLPFIDKVTVAPTAGTNIVSIAPDSALVPVYKRLLNVIAAFNVDGAIHRNRSTLLRTAGIGAVYGQGSYRRPKHEKRDNKLVIHPLAYQCYEAEIYYATQPTAIDLTNAAVELPYGPKLLKLLIEEMLVQAAKANREYPFVQSSLQQEQINP